MLKQVTNPLTTFMIDFSQATQSYNMDRHMESWAADCAVCTVSRQIFSAGVTISTSTL